MRLTMKRIVALVAMCSICWSRVPIAAAPSRDAMAQSAVENLKRGAFGTLETNRLKIEDARRQAMLLLKSDNPALAARAKRTLQLYEIFNAKTQSVRHELIQKLPVTVDRRVTAAGTVVTFSAKGKARLQFAYPATMTSTEAARPVSGPSDESAGSDDCYDGPGPCATLEEMADLGTLVAYTEAEMASLESDVNAQSQEYEAHCSEFPDDCNGDAGPVTGGPSADETVRFGCFGDIGGFFLGLGATLGLSAEAASAASAAAAAGTTLSSTTVLVFNAAIISTGVGTALVAVAAGICIYKAVHRREGTLGEPATFRPLMMRPELMVR